MKKTVKEILGKGSFTVNGSLWLEGNGTRFFGPGPVELLEHIEQPVLLTRRRVLWVCRIKKLGRS